MLEGERCNEYLFTGAYTSLHLSMPGSRDDVFGVSPHHVACTGQRSHHQRSSGSVGRREGTGRGGKVTCPNAHLHNKYVQWGSGCVKSTYTRHVAEPKVRRYRYAHGA